MASEEDAVVEEYASSLEDLTFNSKPLINVLTMLAEENNQFAGSIAKLIERRIYKVQQTSRLPSLYLLDSIIKNVGGDYLQLIAQILVKVFAAVFEKADEKVRKDLYKLRNTWPQYFSTKILHELDVKVHSIDPGWPVTAPPPPSPSIHINPKFLKKGDDLASTLPISEVTKVEEQSVIINHQQRLLELQKLQEAQLRLTEQEIQEHQLKRDLILKKQEHERRSLLTQQQQQIMKMRLETELGDLIASNGPNFLTDAKPTQALVSLPVASIAEPTRSIQNISASRDPRLRHKDQTPAFDNNNKKEQQRPGEKDDIRVEIRPDQPRSVHVSVIGNEQSFLHGRSDETRQKSIEKEQLHVKEGLFQRKHEHSNVEDNHRPRAKGFEQSRNRPSESKKRSRSQSPFDINERWPSYSLERSSNRELNDAEKFREEERPRRRSLDDQEGTLVSRDRPQRDNERNFRGRQLTRRGRGRGRGRGRDSWEDKKIRREDDKLLNNKNFSDQKRERNIDERSRGRGRARQRGPDNRDEKPRPRFKRCDARDKVEQEPRVHVQAVTSQHPEVNTSDNLPLEMLDRKGSQGLRQGKRPSPEPTAKSRLGGPPVKKPKPLLSEGELQEIRARRPGTPPRQIPDARESIRHSPSRMDIDRQHPPEDHILDPAPVTHDAECIIPQELTLEHRTVILDEAERRLSAGLLTKEQYNELIEKLAQFYELQRQQEWERRQQMPNKEHFPPKEEQKQVPPRFQGPSRVDQPPGIHEPPRLDQTVEGGPRVERPPRRGKRNRKTGSRRGGPPRRHDLQRFEDVPWREGPLVHERDGPPMMEGHLGRDGPPMMEGHLGRERPSMMEGHLGRDGPPMMEGHLGRDGPPMMEGRLGRDGPPMMEGHIGRDGPPVMEGHFGRDGPPMMEGHIGRDRPTMMEGHIGRDGPPVMEGRLGRDGPPIMEAPPRHHFEGPHGREVLHMMDGPPQDRPPMMKGPHRMDEGPRLEGHHLRGGHPSIEGPPRFEGPPRINRSHMMEGPSRFEGSHRIEGPPRMDRAPDEHMGPGRPMEIPRDVGHHMFPESLHPMDNNSPGPMLGHGRPMQEFRGPPVEEGPLPGMHHPGSEGPPLPYRHGIPTDDRPGPRHEGPGGLQRSHSPSLQPLRMSGSPGRQGSSTPPLAAIPQTPTKMEKKTVDDLFKKLVQVGIIKVTQEQGPEVPPRIGTPPVQVPPQPAHGPLVPGQPIPGQPVAQQPISNPGLPQQRPPLVQNPQPTRVPPSLHQQLLKQMIEKSKEAATKIPEINLDPEDLKKRYSGIIKILYEGTQCSSCGLRFPVEEAAMYREHLDWHFRRNRREKDGRRIAHRQWYIPLKDWLDYEEITDPEEKAHSSFFDLEKLGGKTRSTKTKGDDSCPVLTSDTEDEARCDVCCEEFEQFWEETSEEWHYKGAVRINGKTYHDTCYQDAKSHVEETEPELEDSIAEEPGKADTAGAEEKVDKEEQVKEEEKSKEEGNLEEEQNKEVDNKEQPSNGEDKKEENLEGDSKIKLEKEVKCDIEMEKEGSYGPENKMNLKSEAEISNSSSNGNENSAVSENKESTEPSTDEK